MTIFQKLPKPNILMYFLAIQTLSSIATHGTRPIISLYSDSQGFSVAAIGFIVSIYAFFPMLIAVQMGKWLDTYGARKMCILGGIFMVTALTTLTIYPSFYVLLVSQVLLGLGQISTLISLQKTVGNLPGNIDKLVVAFSLTGSIGELVGPLISGFGFEYLGFKAAIGISAALVLIGLLISIIAPVNSWINGKKPAASEGKNKTSSLDLLKDSNLRKVFIISGLVLYSKDLFVAYFPVYANKLGISASSIGLIISIMAGAAVTIRLIQFKLVGKFGRGAVLRGTLAISGIAYVLIPMTSIPVLLAVLAIFLGFGLGLGQPLSIVYLLTLIQEQRHGEALGLRLTFNRASQFTAPIVFGGIGSTLGLAPIFWISGIVLLAGSLLAITHAAEKIEVNLPA